MEPEDTRRRIRAARALADLTVKQLAAKLGPGLGSKTLGMIERGEREVRPRELREIAGACQVPYEFFTEDLDRLAQPAAEEPVAPWQEQMAAMADRQERFEANITRLRGAVIALAAGNLQLTREQLAQDETDRPEGLSEAGG